MRMTEAREEYTQPDFLISYNHADADWAQWIAWQLEAAGYSTIIQAWDFRPSENFVLAMQDAARRAKRTAALLSPQYLAAQYTQPEWAAAFAQDPTGEKGTLVPIRIRECTLAGLLSPIVYIDLVNLDEETASKVLLQGVCRERQKPSESPRFPRTAAPLIPAQPRFPGALPTIWNVPHVRNPNFTGREELLSMMWRRLTSGHTTTPVLPVSGLGGVGKTQLAVEYAYRQSTDYTLVWWLRAEEPATLATDYASLAQQLPDLFLKEYDNQSIVIDAVRQWLGRHQGWLLIFDNAHDPAGIHTFLPQGGSGHIVVTSRNPNWGDWATPLTVPVMDEGDAVALLAKRTRHTDERSAKTLASALGFLPLALVQASAYIEATAISVADYLTLFEQRRSELWKDEYAPYDYPYTVATTWSIAIDAIRKESPVSGDLLTLCAYLGPENISRSVFTQSSDLLPTSLASAAVDPFVINRAVAPLRRYSLLDVNSEDLSLHRLVQAVIRDGLTEEEKRLWATTAVRLLEKTFPSLSDDTQTWPTCARLLPHALAAARHAEGLSVGIEETGRLLNYVGLYVRGRVRFVEAEELYRRALHLQEQRLQGLHPDVTTTLDNLAELYRVWGRYDEAESFGHRARDAQERSLGTEHPRMASILNNLGELATVQGRYPEAEQHHRQALTIREKLLGQEHPETATTCNNLAELYRIVGRYAEAEPLYRRALKIWEQQVGISHSYVATGLNNLALLFQAEGRYEEAEPLHIRALQIDEETLGSEHPEVATGLNNLAECYQSQERYQEAEPLYQRAITIREKTFGEEHPDVAAILNNLAELYRTCGRFEEAEPLYDRARAIWKKALGSDHPNVATVLHNLGGMYMTQHRYDEAETVLLRALTLCERGLGPESPDVANSLNSLAGLYAKQGDFEKAEPYCQRALKIAEHGLGREHPLTRRISQHYKFLLER